MKAFAVFEGGGAKGYAHVGALQAVEERKIELEAVAGSSTGAVIALLVAAGYTAGELFRTSANGDSGLLCANWIDQLNKTDWAAFESFRKEYLDENSTQPSVGDATKLGYWKLFKLSCSAASAFRRHSHLFNQIWMHFGLTDVSGFRKWLDDAVRKKLGIGSEPVLFQHLRIPLKVVAGDLLSGEMRVFGGSNDGDLNAVDAAVASACYPLFFKPFRFQGSLFVDGGLLSNLPAWVFDDERLRLHKATPTFGFQFVEVPLVGRPAGKSNPPTSLPEFLKRLATTSIFGGQALGSRGIEDYYAFDLVADIDTLAFHEIGEKARDLVDAGRKGVARFFDTQLGPSDPDQMERILGIVANFAVQALDRSAKNKLPQLRTFVLIETSDEFIKVAYSANAKLDADDRLKIRAGSPGMAECFTLREPIVVFVPEIPDAIRWHPVFKYEYASRPQDIITVYVVPIFADPTEWLKEEPQERSKPIAGLVFDSPEDIRYLLQEPVFEDRLATYAQICGEYLRGQAVQSYGSPDGRERDVSLLTAPKEAGLLVSGRKARTLFQDDETLELVRRIERQIQQKA